ncbi:amidase [Elioraea thermophila]|uniref:amidase n=1 Tax=Elioraea thermophila TaxID=2185104 RepID=UPI000DF17D35|nr:amidase [Elioraea thermophila]
MSDTATLSATTLARAYARRDLSPVEVAEAALSRIARLEPTLNAMVLVDAEGALRAAREAENRWFAGRPLSPLDGVPATVKDLMDLAGFPTRRGSRVTDPRPASHDAPAVAALKAAGCVILGKTTTTEFGWKSPGDCPLNGTTRNPWDARCTPGGSSSGAGAAAAAGYGPLHIGTDAGGSIRIPAAWCGIVGVKPTFGRVPQWPLGAFAQVAVAGPMTRSVADAALMLAAMSRHDWRDPFALPDPPRGWLDDIDAPIEGLRVALVRRLGFDPPAEASQWAAVERAAEALGEAGAIIEEADPVIPDARAVFVQVWANALARLVASIPPERRDLLDPALLALAERAPPMSAGEYLSVQAAAIEIAHGLAAFLRRYDALLCPVVPGPAPRADEPLERPEEELWQRWAPWTFAFNLSRQPAVAVPAGLGEDGLPRAVQIVAPLYEDARALRLARTIEAALAPATLAPL